MRKRRRAAAVQDAGADFCDHRQREASWSAPVLWRFWADLSRRSRTKAEARPFGLVGARPSGRFNVRLCEAWTKIRRHVSWRTVKRRERRAPSVGGQSGTKVSPTWNASPVRINPELRDGRPLKLDCSTRLSNQMPVHIKTASVIQRLPIWRSPDARGMEWWVTFLGVIKQRFAFGESTTASELK